MNVTFTTKQTKAIHVLISQLHIDNKVTKHFQRRYIDDNMMNPEEAQKIYDRMPHYKERDCKLSSIWFCEYDYSIL